MTLSEAMAMHRAVVFADLWDVPDYLLSGDKGYVVPVGDAKATAEGAVGELAAKLEPCSRFAEHARGVVLRELDTEGITASTAACFRQIADIAYAKL